MPACVLRHLVRAIVVAGMLALPALRARADEYRYPHVEPVLRITLPGGWPAEEQDGPAKLLLCSPPGDSTFIMSVMSLPTVGGKADLQAILTRIVEAGAQGSGMTGVTVSKVAQVRIGGGPRVFTRITASGKHDDESSAYTYYAFTLPGTGKTYAVGVAGLQAMIDAHKAEFEAVARSIQAVR